LREQILIGKEKLNRFEQQHHVNPPSLKKSRHNIECLASFGRLPLRLGELPNTDGNQHSRFELINVFNDKEIVLENCFLKNEKGSKLKLPNHFVAPLHSLGFSIGNKKIQSEDILIPADFCTFDNADNLLVIEDSCNPPHFHRLYPVLVETINSLENTQNFPMEINALKMDGKKDTWRGFELKNRGKNCVLLQGMFITREKTNFKQQLPERALQPGDTMRFVFSQNNVNQANNPDDILIDEKNFGKLDFPDKLLLTDKNNNYVVLYDSCNLRNNSGNCLIM